MIHIFREYEPKEIDRVNNVMKIVLTALAAVLLCFGCTKINEKMGFKNNHPLEEFVESVIEKKLCLPEGTLDLTPESPE